MYQGEIMESGPVEPIFRTPAAPVSEGADAGGAAFRHEAGRAAEAAARHRGGSRQPDAWRGARRKVRDERAPACCCRCATCARPSPCASPTGASARKARGEACRRSTMSASTSGAASASAWSAKAAAARRRSARSSCARSTPDAGSVVFDDGSGPIDVLAARGRRSCRTCRTQGPDRLPGPVRLAQSAHDGGRHPRRAVRDPRPRRRASSGETVQRADEGVGLDQSRT